MFFLKNFLNKTFMSNPRLTISDGTRNITLPEQTSTLFQAFGLLTGGSSLNSLTPAQYDALLNISKNHAFNGINDSTYINNMLTQIPSFNAKLAKLQILLDAKLNISDFEESDQTLHGHYTYTKPVKCNADSDCIDSDDNNLITKGYADNHYTPTEGIAGPQGPPVTFIGDWSECRTYSLGDAVYHCGSSYISLSNENDSSIYNCEKWHLLAKAGKNLIFKGEYERCHEYHVNDVVTFHGSSYLSLVNCNRNFPTDSCFWVVVAKAGDNMRHKGKYCISRTYCYFDVVTYDGSSFLSLTNDNTYLPVMCEYWAPLALKGEGFYFKGEYNLSTRYHPNDVVTYLGSSYISIACSTGEYPSDSSQVWFSLAVKGVDGRSFEYREEWVRDTSYNVNDVVTFFGSTYISVVNNNTSFPTVECSWRVLAKGGESFIFQGAWLQNAEYMKGDVVTDLGTAYISSIDRNTDLLSVTSSWRVFAKSGTSLNPKGEWDILTVYHFNDMVSYRGSSFVCIIEETALGITQIDDTSSWTIVAQKSQLIFEGEWNECTTYELGAVVTHRGSCFINTFEGNVGDEPIDDEIHPNTPSRWSLLAKKGKSLYYRDYWVDSDSYEVNDIVTFHGSSYISKACNNSAVPTDECKWGLLAKRGDTNFKGEWNCETSYELSEVVTHRGSSYISIICDNTSPVTDTCAWSILAEKGKSTVFKGEWRECETYDLNDLVTNHGSCFISLRCENTGYLYDECSWSIVAKKGAFMTYKGEWEHCHTYCKYDVVIFRGSSYISLREDNSSDPCDPCKWGLIAKRGDIAYVGEWDDDEIYGKGDVTVYEGSSYISKTCNNSAVPTNECKWGLLASKGDNGTPGAPGNNGSPGSPGDDGRSFDWQGRYRSCETYEVDDVVEYHGSSYISIVCNNSAVPTDHCKWNLMAKEGEIKYEGGWNCETSYRLGDVVTFHDSSYISTSSDNSAVPTDQCKWGLLAKKGSSMKYIGDYSCEVSYDKNDVVRHHSKTYVSLVCENEGNDTCDGEYWGLISKDGVSFDYKDDWECEESYDKNDVVSFHGSSYISKVCNNSAAPTDECKWGLLARKGAIDHQGRWRSCETYDINQVVEYRGCSYISLKCGNTDTPTDECSWGVLALKGSSVTFKGQYSCNITYSLNDVVSFFGSSYISKICDNDNEPTDECSWGLLAKKGEIKYEGHWNCETSYGRGDVVEFHGSTYISLVCDNDSVPTDECKWGIIAKQGLGFDYEGNWDCEESYDKNDVVQFHGSSYVSKVCDNSAVPTDQCKWGLIAKQGLGFYFKGPWSCEDSYDKNDVVSFHGSSYVSKVCDNDSIPTDECRWGILAEQSKIKYEGRWECEETYELGDVVQYHGTSFISTHCNNSAVPTDECRWGILAAKGDSVSYKGTWRYCEVYEKGDIVTFNGGSFVSKICNNSGNQVFDEDSWGIIAEKGEVKYRNRWQEDELYCPGDVVVYHDSSYISTHHNNTAVPTDECKWGLLAKKGGTFKYRGAWRSCEVYDKDDVVEHRGSSYISLVCSNDSDVDDECSWGLIAEGGLSTDYKGVWEHCTSYGKNDIVTYRDSSYISKSCENISVPTDECHWGIIAKRARIAYEGDYSCETSYEIGDVVYNRGSSYISLICNNDRPLSDRCAWGFLARTGASMKPVGAWSCETCYASGDVVIFKGSSYISLVDHNDDNVPTDECKWQLLAKAGVSLKYQGKWRHCESYEINDVVYYEHSSYVSLKCCNTSNPECAEEWGLLSRSPDMKGHWSCEEVYEEEDIVEYRGSSYYSKHCNNSAVPTDECRWGLLAAKGKSLEYEGHWDCEDTYEVNDVVEYCGSSYISTVCNNSAVPTDECRWGLMAKHGKSIEHQGDWSECETYDINDVVVYNNSSSYISKRCNNTSVPTDQCKWGLLAKSGMIDTYACLSDFAYTMAYPTLSDKLMDPADNDRFSLVDAGMVYGMDVSTVDRTLTVRKSGTYSLSYSLTVSQLPEDKTCVGLAVNGQPVNQSLSWILYTGCVAKTVLVNLEKDQVLTFEAANFGGDTNNSFRYYDFCISMFRINDQELA